jgi:hypothetical protein
MRRYADCKITRPYYTIYRRKASQCSKVGVTIELSVKFSKESTEPMSLLKTENKVVEVG